ncbi:NAD synthetase, NH3-dependent [Campylobacter blaseri]|uniref:NH(3)-dependent NAD(+) synthetase n=1 Tax=Campylobacter blaseri TaxID=2042961 RepID=A0A2P8R249_9BACT|nr:NAD+ synthase [Campylobacter blaseri]PSM52576.1 NAD(+) synthetase [Campylobacter blaseri]PSM54224.1 NAD(+) synthetase [Campylobacter blaseri]QKF85875.1 NAD synthetase, NH3-dependent [Campylobacter blaseri]
MNYKKLEKELIKFLKKSLKDTGRENFIVGISGGLDSAIVSTLCAKISIKHTFGIIIPSGSSSKANIEDAISHCNDFGIIHKIINIETMISAYEDNIGMLNKLRKGNLTSRLRMCVLYDISNYMQAVVVGTSNLSERMLGYGTVYGDLAYAFNPIGEIFKTELFEFAKYLNIDDKIINKAPSGDLWEGQSDEAELGYTYKEMDKVLKDIKDNGLSFNKLEKKYDNELVNFIRNRIKSNNFKLKMPPIANIRDLIKE